MTSLPSTVSAANATTVLPVSAMVIGSPELATKITNQIYVAVGSLAVLIWDILLHLPQDYSLLVKNGVRVSLIIYFLARITSLAYTTGVVVTIRSPIEDCDLIRRVSMLYPFTIPLTVLLFVIRVSALYNNNKYIIVFFSLTWLSVLAACTAPVPIGALGVQLGSTNFCVDDKTLWAAKFSSFCLFFHDSLIFVATSWAFMRNSYSDVNVRNGFRVMVLGERLPAFSKSVLREGQGYFLVTLILNLVFIATYYIPPNSVMTPRTFGLPLFVLINNMSSHVYRNVQSGFYRDRAIGSSAEEEHSPRGQQENISLRSTPTTRSQARAHGRDVESLGEEGYMKRDLDSAKGQPVVISLERVKICRSQGSSSTGYV